MQIGLQSAFHEIPYCGSWGDTGRQMGMLISLFMTLQKEPKNCQWS